ncbi:hypothetical protein B9T31_09560 [Acinetobacter sp. ANC 4558]|uniref:hypothetical protein n=1 Tax=Acinetobacter sp. ANC 4558 TaxID=1977876 RepID=UPI000A35370C|nr:hypothetical protein [Acinetobacter sp. ANC 4558]OTG85832.1 hypothetical protein B9T31_09560 [Acinetobacter sp. ANC 4558]
MIVYQTKHKTVSGISAEKVISLSKDNWSKLPTWFKKQFQENKIMIGGSVVQVECRDRCLRDAKGTDMIFIDDKNKLSVMNEKEFLEVYEDPFANK